MAKHCVIGPNLNDQSTGEFHVHAAGCQDLRNYGFGKRLGGDISDVKHPVDLDTLQDMVLYVYDNGIMEESPDTPWQAYLSEFHVFPCCRLS